MLHKWQNMRFNLMLFNTFKYKVEKNILKKKY